MPNASKQGQIKKEESSVPLSEKVNTKASLEQIKASAGSGKTHTLISKLLDIFCSQAENSTHFQINENQRKRLSSVLAITFTNAAATDMKMKLISRLKNIALGLENDVYTKEEAKKSIQACIANYSALNIRTIDSFLLMLLKQNIFEYHLPPRFDILFSNEEFFSPLYDDLAFTALYKNKDPDDEASKTLLKYYEEVYSNFQQLTDHKGFLGLERVRTSILALCSALSKVSEEKRALLSNKASVFAAFKQSEKTYEQSLFALENFTIEHSLKIKKDLKDAFEEFKSKNKISPLFSLELSILKEKSIFAKDLKVLEEVENAEKLRKLETLFTDVSKAHKKAYLLKSSLKFQPFIDLARLTLEMQPYEEEAKENLLSQRVVQLLSEAIQEKNLLPAILERMPYELDFLLVDEFQDTNKEQWEVIRQFVDEVRAKNGTFTYVGDVKQAIYSWRGGDSRLFEDVFTQLDEPKAKEFLDTNWRSSKYIVEFNNMVFEQFENIKFTEALEETIMKDDCIAKTSFAKDLTSIYTQVAQNLSPKHANKEEGRVCLYPFQAAGNSNEVLYSKLKFHFIHALSDASKMYDYKDMAVLVRNNAECEMFAQWLTEENVPVITEGALLLSANFIIKQCISFLEFVKDTNNTIALWHLLGFKGLFTFDDKELLELEDYLKAKEQNRSLYDCLKNKKSKNSIKAYEIIEDLLSKRHDLNVYSLVCLLFEKTKCYERFPHESGFFARFLELIYQADKNKISTLISFLSYWEEEGYLEKIPMPEGINAVRVMTIHKSKGAEFDLVYVWDNLKKKTKIDTLKHYELENLSFFAPHSSYHSDYEDDNKLLAIEAMNLLYVALTRAKKELHVFYKESTSTRVLPLPYIFADILPACKKNDTLSRYEFGVKKEDKTKQNALFEIEKKKKEKNPLLNSLQFREAALNYSELKFIDRTKEDALKKGLIYHAFLEKYFKFAKYKDIDSSKEVERYAGHILSEYSFEKKEEESLKNELISLFSWIKSLDGFENWKKYALSEQSMLNEKNELLRADLCVIEEESISIIDFKTGNENEVYKEQVSNYMKLVSTFPQASGKKVKGFILYLDLKKIVELEG